MAAFIAAILSGLIPNPVEASETYIPSNSPSISIERVVDTLRGGFKPDPNQVKGIVYRIKEDDGLVRAAQEACKNADVQKDVNHLEEQLAKENQNPGIGSKPICKGVTEHQGKNGGRLYVRESDDVIEILAKSGKKKSNQQFVINRLTEIYG
jgi:putative component of toxin-antitoxin plasmid stabilization module